LLQIQKLKHSNIHYFEFEKILFCSRDKKALKLAKHLQIEVLTYIDIQKQAKEVGISIP